MKDFVVEELLEQIGRRKNAEEREEQLHKNLEHIFELLDVIRPHIKFECPKTIDSYVHVTIMEDEHGERPELYKALKELFYVENNNE